MLKVFWVGRKVEDSRCLNLMWVAADTRDECHQVPRVETGQQGKWRMVRVQGVCTHNRLGWCKRRRAPTTQMSLCQRQPGIPEGVFQWWFYPHRPSTGKRREWVNAELATLYSHTVASLWVSHISWDYFWITVQLKAFDHRGACIWYFFFLCYMVCRILIPWPGVEVVPPALEAQRHNHWTTRITGHPGESWCLHLRISVVASNPASASPSPGGPSWSTSATLSKLRRHPISTTQMTLSWHVFTLFLSLRLSWAFLKTK